MKKLTHSISYALQGIAYLVRTQRNAQFHILSAIVAIGLGIWLKISITEWIFVALCIGLVLAVEAFNTAIETLCDALHPETHPKIKIVKDLAAGAVLIISIGALVVGSIIFLPKIINFID